MGLPSKDFCKGGRSIVSASPHHPAILLSPGLVWCPNPALQLPQTLTRSAFIDISRDALATAAASDFYPTDVPSELIRHGLLAESSSMRVGKYVHAQSHLPSSVPRDRMSGTLSVPLRAVPQGVLLSYPTHVLAISALQIVFILPYPWRRGREPLPCTRSRPRHALRQAAASACRPRLPTHSAHPPSIADYPPEPASVREMFLFSFSRRSVWGRYRPADPAHAPPPAPPRRLALLCVRGYCRNVEESCGPREGAVARHGRTERVRCRVVGCVGFDMGGCVGRGVAVCTVSPTRHPFRCVGAGIEAVILGPHDMALRAIAGGLVRVKAHRARPGRVHVVRVRQLTLGRHVAYVSLKSLPLSYTIYYLLATVSTLLGSPYILSFYSYTAAVARLLIPLRSPKYDVL
ncbi:Clampless protein 1 [Mycena sanguinolenta]|uniref:Clampless protein 1 n=1 Tax=Mycena sanguinolenta TaxID=230812 RepID=A0A8H7DCA5_9AGAR|nr:Clampless protein 1 [Mycena sanguinolenta]